MPDDTSATALSSGTDDENPFDNPEQNERRRVAQMFDGDPLPLAAQNLPPFPVRELPGPFAAMVESTAAALQVDTAMAGPMVLAALSAACGGRVEAVVQSDWIETCVLHIVISAGPSERKSPAMSRATAPLYAAERDLIRVAAVERTKLLTRRQIAEQRAKTAATEASKHARPASDSGDAEIVDPIEIAVELAAKAEAIVVPAVPRVIADDVTPEAMVSRLAENDGCLAIMSAEGGQFATLAGRYSSGVANLDAWLKGYAGDPIRVERKGRDAEIVDRPALTVCLATQPDVLAQACSDPRFRGQGLLARIAFAQPRAMVGHRDPDAAVPTPEHVTGAYAAALADLTRTLHEREHGPAPVKLDPAARREVADLERQIEARLVSGDLSGDMEAWGGKHVGRVIRIALLLHMAEHGPSGVELPVSVAAIRSAARIGEFFAAHSRAAHGITDTGEIKRSDLTAAFDYLLKRSDRARLSPIDVRSIAKSGPIPLRRKSSRGPILAMLADLNLIAASRPRSAETGRLGSAVVYVHPKVAR